MLNFFVNICIYLFIPHSPRRPVPSSLSHSFIIIIILIHSFIQQIRAVFLQWLPWILRMSRPGRKITRKSILISNRMKELELKERSSKSLLANVLDIEDDFRQQALNSSQTAIGSR